MVLICATAARYYAQRPRIASASRHQSRPVDGAHQRGAHFSTTDGAQQRFYVPDKVYDVGEEKNPVFLTAVALRMMIFSPSIHLAGDVIVLFSFEF